MEIGYKSICKKSVYAKDKTWMDYLMKFSMYCKENSIETFVDSMTDFAELVKINSPGIEKFAATCLN